MTAADSDFFFIKTVVHLMASVYYLFRNLRDICAGHKGNTLHANSSSLLNVFFKIVCDNTTIIDISGWQRDVTSSVSVKLNSEKYCNTVWNHSISPKYRLSLQNL